MSIKLLVMDIDDTLVYHSGPVSEGNMRAIKAAQNAGVYITLATGRGYFGSSRVVHQLGLNTYVINYGGAMINDAKTEQPIFTTELDNAYVQEILAMADDMNLHAHLYQGDCIVYGKPHHYADMYVSALNLPHKLEPNIRNIEWHNVPKVLIITEAERVDELLPIFKKHFDGRVAVSASSPGFIEFNRLGENKGAAVAKLAALLGVKREEVACIGDNTLDYEMIEYAGLSAVVENGNPMLKQIADVIVPACTEDGAAYFIENYVLDKAPKEKYRIGFDIGGTNLVCGILDRDFNLIKKQSRPFVLRDGDVNGDALAEDLYKLARDACKNCGITLACVPSIGVCIPGSVDTEQGIVIDAHNLGLHDANFRESVSKRFDKPVSLLNDADAAALAEQRIGALAGTENSMLVTIGTGIGVGIVLDGKLFHGGRGCGVEAGHVQMDVHGENCTCGRRGCIETLCSATWLNNRAKELFDWSKSKGDTRYENFAENDQFDAKALIAAAKAGDPDCCAVWDRYLDNLANALGSYINILDPQRIAIGGGVCGAGAFLLDPLNERTAKQSFFRIPTPVVKAKLGNDAGLVGAAMYNKD